MPKDSPLREVLVSWLIRLGAVVTFKQSECWSNRTKELGRWFVRSTDATAKGRPALFLKVPTSEHRVRKLLSEKLG
jgi:hypothetical protein